MSSLFRCPACQLEGDAHLWAKSETGAGQRLACLICAGRLRLVPLGAGDPEAQAWLEAHHVSRALAEADNQQRIFEAAQAALDIRFAEAVDHELYGAVTSEALHVECRPRTADA